LNTDDKLPKLKLLQLSLYIVDLLLVSSGDEEAVKEPRVRTIWHILFFSLVGLVITQFVLNHSLQSVLPNSAILTLVWRLFLLASWTWLLVVLIVLAYRHYRYLLITSKDLNFKSIAFFYVVGILIFGLLYRDLYVFGPHLFAYPDPVVVPVDKARLLSLIEGYKFSFDFYIYSACTTVSLNYARISSASPIVSILNFCQVVFSLFIVALMVSTFVQKVGKNA
jgi:hypothetical protein